MHTLSSSFVLGYHGCDQSVAETLLEGKRFQASKNDYDWLGPGAYFWEANPKRGLQYARELSRSNLGPKVKTPTVIGAIIDLGLCLDLTSSAGIEHVKDAHEKLVAIHSEAELALPENSKDLLRRNLDCAVIKNLHKIRADGGLQPIDTIKGIFIEGAPIYPSAGFHDKTHVQVCVCNPNQIKGVFRVRKRDLA